MRRVKRTALFLAMAATALAVACIYTGGDPRADPRLTHPMGVEALVRLNTDENVQGELLSMDAAGNLVLLTRDSIRSRIVVVPAGRATSLWSSRQNRHYKLPLSPQRFDELRSDARFPFGITDSARAALMRSIQQERVDTVGPSATSAAPLEDFVAAARAGTQRYQSAELAAADGFKRVGTEFPFMGEHWVNLARVLENRFDAASPSVLTYITKDGARVLAGVGYGALLRPGEAVPASVAPASAWHEHSGAVADESLPIHGSSSSHHNQGAGASEAADDSLRFMVLHAWVWTPNPQGMFVTDNPALPLVRLGAQPVLDSDALRGLTLAQDSAGYYAQMLVTSLRANEMESRVVDRVLASRRALARQGVGGATVDASALRDAWIGLWPELERALPGRASDLGRLRALLR